MSKMLGFPVFYFVIFALIEAFPTSMQQASRSVQTRGGINGYQTYGGYQKFGGYQVYGGYRDGGDYQSGSYQGGYDYEGGRGYQDSDEYQSRRGYGGRSGYRSRGVYQDRGSGRPTQDDDRGDERPEKFQYVPRSCRGCRINIIGNGYGNPNKVYLYD